MEEPYGEALEADLWDLSGRRKRRAYRARLGRSAHDALDALSVGIIRCKVSWVLDADVRGVFVPPRGRK